MPPTTPSLILAARGVPGGPLSIVDLLRHTGDVWYVSSVTGDDGNAGNDPSAPFATLAAAIAAATASNGDVIYLLPGHNEGKGDAQWTVNKAGIDIIGLGQGSRRPRFDFDHANASIDITANDVRISNITLLPSVTAVLIGIDIAAAVLRTQLDNIEVLPGEDGAGVDEFATGVKVGAGCTSTKIEDSRFTQHASAAGVVQNILLSGASDLVVIRRCVFFSAGAGLVAAIAGDTNPQTNLLIEDCAGIMDAEPIIELVAAGSGIIRNVDVHADLGTLNAGIVSTGCARFDCRIAEPGEAGGVIGTVTVDD